MDTKMKKTMLILTIVTAIAITSCTNNEQMFSEMEEQWQDMPNATPGGDTSGQTASIGDLTSFDISINTASLDEEETVNADDEDYIENNAFDTTVRIAFNGSSATVIGATDGITVETDGAHVTVKASVKACYELSGTTSDGGLKIYSEKKYKVVLNGVDITNTTGPAINSQSKKRGYFVIADGTTNTLTDGTTYTPCGDEDMKGTVFSEGKLLFSGKGMLDIKANCKSGIASDDYVLLRPGNNIHIKATQGNGIKANDAIYVNGGVINIETSGTAAKGLNSDSLVVIKGGRTTVITTGGGEYDSDDKDTKASAGIKADYGITINDGEIYLKSTGAGGKGMNCDAAITINGGTVKVITTGKKYAYGNQSSSPKGIKADGDITFNGGAVAVRATGGEGAEGIESKSVININAGCVESYAYDDAINAKKGLYINGGYTFAYATNNDGIDSNGQLTVTGGVVIGCGTTQPEDGFDCDQNTFTITGGTVIGIGGGTSTPSSSTCKQAVAVVGGSNISANAYLTLANSDGNNILAFKVPRSYNQYTLLMSSPSMTTGKSYVISAGSSVSGGTDFDGYVTGATVSGGSALATLTLSNVVTTSNYSGGMGGGGGRPGGFR